MGNVGIGANGREQVQLASPGNGLADSLRKTPVPAATPPARPAQDRDKVTQTAVRGDSLPVVDLKVDKQPVASPKAGTAKPLHRTEIYSMSGEQLDAYDTTSRFSRVMVDEKAYLSYLQGKFASLNPDSAVEATQFVDTVVAALDKDEKQTGVDLVATEKGLSLSFEGEAYEKGWSTITRQYGEGHLDVVATFDNGKKAVVDSFDAVSGPMRNGLIPNGKFRVSAPVGAVNQFPDETGKFGFKMVITPLERMARGDFRIHSVQSKAKKLMWMTEGCVGLSGGHSENVRFFGLMQDYFKTRKSIDLTVAIDGNANVKTQLGEQANYK